MNVLTDYEILFNVDTCDEGHSIQKKKMQRMFVWSTTNAPLNNFCSKENNTYLARIFLARDFGRRSWFVSSEGKFVV